MSYLTHAWQTNQEAHNIKIKDELWKVERAINIGKNKGMNFYNFTIKSPKLCQQAIDKYTNLGYDIILKWNHGYYYTVSWENASPDCIGKFINKVPLIIQIMSSLKIAFKSILSSFISKKN